VKYMSIIASKKSLLLASKHLATNDPVLKTVIDRFGVCVIEPHTNYYQELVESIIGQQLSVKAGAAIRKRFVALFGGTFPKPEAILEKPVEELRTAGLSGAKAGYIRDIARRVIEGSLKFDTIDSLSNEEVITELTAVKGIGVWTAHMFMMFCMGRLDILPVGDLGIKNGIMRLYRLPVIPTPGQMLSIAVQGSWTPYQSVAAWYIWQSLDNAPK
jgi:DNA-3-methyladenine glycosylase II